MRRVWVGPGEVPRAEVWHRYQWLYVYGFVQPNTGKTEWFLMPKVSTECFGLVLKEFASCVGASAQRRIVLLLDQAGYHKGRALEVPEGIHLESLPPLSPELQPAERLWPLVDEPLANKALADLDELELILERRCATLSTMPQSIEPLTRFHWWPPTDLSTT